MTEASVHIQRLKVRLRGIDEATARSLASGLGDAIASAVDTTCLSDAAGRHIGRVDLGSIDAPRGTTPQALQADVAAAVAKVVGPPVAPRTGGGA